MKMYSISKWAFWGICLLILALPVSRHWRLFSAGDKATGTIGEFVLLVHEPRIGERTVQYASEVFFLAGDSVCLTHGPFDQEMTTGETVSIIYDPENPTRNCLLTFSSFYLSSYTILPVILLVLWGAFYLSFNYYRKNSRSGSRTPASSPYRKRNSGSRDPKRNTNSSGQTPGISS